MKKSYFLFIVLTTFSILSCVKKTPPIIKDGQINLQFEARYQNIPFELNKEYLTHNAVRITPEKLIIYLSDIHLINGVKPILFSEIEQLNFSNKKSLSKILYIQPTDFHKIEFGIGVKESLNKQDPTSFPITHPLSYRTSLGLYWSWNSGYIFSKYEGRVNTDDVPDGTFAIHIGTNNLYSKITLSHPFNIEEDKITTLKVIFHIDQFLYSTNDSLNLKERATTHSTGDGFEMAKKAALLVKNAITIEDE